MAGMNAVRGDAPEASTIQPGVVPAGVRLKTALPLKVVSCEGWQAQAMRRGAVAPVRSRRTALWSAPLATITHAPSAEAEIARGVLMRFEAKLCEAGEVVALRMTVTAPVPESVQ